MNINEKHDIHFLFAASYCELYSKIDGIRMMLRIHFIVSYYKQLKIFI